MVRLAIVRGLTYTGMGQVRSRWLIPTYSTAFRWTGNRADAEDLTAWIFHKLSEEFHAPELVQVIEERVAELTSEAVARHWSERYGVNLSERPSGGSSSTIESLLADLTTEMYLTLVLRFVRRRPIATIANQFRTSVREANRQVFAALAQVAERIGLESSSTGDADLCDVSDYVTDLVALRRPLRFEADSDTWPVMIAACHVQAAIAGNDLPSRRFVRSLESSARRFVTELRIWSA